MSTAFEAAMKRAVAAERGEIAEIDTPEPKHIRVKTEDKTLGRLIMESSLYDNNPTARLILNQLVACRRENVTVQPIDINLNHEGCGTGPRAQHRTGHDSG